jgi:hypothetical protein
MIEKIYNPALGTFTKHFVNQDYIPDMNVLNALCNKWDPEQLQVYIQVCVKAEMYECAAIAKKEIDRRIIKNATIISVDPAFGEKVDIREPYQVEFKFNED